MFLFSQEFLGLQMQQRLMEHFMVSAHNVQLSS
jgi:hypothetical protein